MNFSKKWIKGVVILLSITGSFFLGKEFGNPNDELKYSDVGTPTNCRALIYENYKRYVLKETHGLSAEDALTSINRNCGHRGNLWED